MTKMVSKRGVGSNPSRCVDSRDYVSQYLHYILTLIRAMTTYVVLFKKRVVFFTEMFFVRYFLGNMIFFSVKVSSNMYHGPIFRKMGQNLSPNTDFRTKLAQKIEGWFLTDIFRNIHDIVL